MLSTVLRSKRAIQVNIQIMRTFVRFRQMLAFHEGLARKLAGIERKYDKRFKAVFDVLRQMMTPPEKENVRSVFSPYDRNQRRSSC